GRIGRAPALRPSGWAPSWRRLLSSSSWWSWCSPPTLWSCPVSSSSYPSPPAPHEECGGDPQYECPGHHVEHRQPQRVGDAVGNLAPGQRVAGERVDPVERCEAGDVEHDARQREEEVARETQQH